MGIFCVWSRRKGDLFVSAVERNVKPSEEGMYDCEYHVYTVS